MASTKPKGIKKRLTPFDTQCMVIGLGVIGSWTCLELAKRGCKVLGIERFTPAHDLGSSWGETRLIRKYPLTMQNFAEDSWREWGALGTLHPVGLKNVTENTFEEAGYLEAEGSVLAAQKLAQEKGAELHFSEKMLSYDFTDPEIIRVETDKAEYFTEKLFLTTGGWTYQFLPTALKLTLKRAPQFWFSAPNSYRESPCLCFTVEEGVFYVFPANAQGMIKVIRYEPFDSFENPDQIDRTVSASMMNAFESFVKKYLPEVDPQPKSQSICFFSETPDEKFLLDFHPKNTSIAFMTGCSGLAFKYAPSLAKALIDLKPSFT